MTLLARLGPRREQPAPQPVTVGAASVGFRYYLIMPGAVCGVLTPDDDPGPLRYIVVQADNPAEKGASGAVSRESAYTNLIWGAWDIRKAWGPRA